jgi:hypothetical protein
MRCSVTSTVLSTTWRNGVLSLDQGAPAATQHLRDKPLGVRQFQHVVCGLTNRAQDGTAPDRERLCELVPEVRGERWSRLSEQFFRVDKWSVCRG